MRRNFIMSPKIDFCFKELMQDEEVRKGFIAAVLHVSPDEIISTELLPTHLRKEHENDKLGILDVRVLMNGNVQLDMEIQLSLFKLWPERSMFYLGKMYVEQFQKGQDYDMLGKCIHVGILDFELFAEDEEYDSVFHLWEDNRNRLYSDKLEIHILELPKVRKNKYPDSELLRWLQFINAEREEEFEMLAKDNEYMKKAFDRLRYISADEQKQLDYEARLVATMDHNYMMKQSREEGLAEGARHKLIDLVQKKYQKGLSTSEIADLLEEPLEVIQEIVSELNKGKI